MENYIYKAFGLIIKSDIEFIELITCDEVPSVSIKFGSTPDHIEGNLTPNKTYEINANELLWSIDGIGTFYIYKDIEIICDINKGVTSNHYRSYILGMGLSFILIHRGLLPMHGCSFIHQSAAVLFLGKSGAGKSTMSEFLKRKNHKLLTDDILAVEYNHVEDQLLAYPAYPSQRISKRIVNELSLDQETLPVIYTSSGYKKFVLDMTEYFYRSPVPLKMIFELVVNEQVDKVHYKAIHGAEKIMVLNEHINGRRLINDAGMQHYYFPIITKIAKEIPFYRIERPKREITVADQYDIMFRILHNLPMT